MTADSESKKTIDAGRLQHLNMLQNVISRMASNSFLVKGWSITLISALLAFATKDKISVMAWIAILPWLAFWTLDGFFLHQERLFRKLYDFYRRQPQHQPTDFSMNTLPVSDEVASWFGVVCSRTLLIFHGLLGLLIGLVILAGHLGWMV